MTAENKIVSAVDDLSYILPSVLDSLESAGQLETYIHFIHLLSEKTFPLDNICYLLFLDLVQWFSNYNTSNMRYNEHTIKFWHIGYIIFHGKYLCPDLEILERYYKVIQKRCARSFDI